MKITVLEQKIAAVADLQYGVFLTGVAPSADSVYTKIKKAGVSSKVGLTWPAHHCVLLNVAYGTVRAVPGDTPCTPLDGTLNLWRDDTQNWRK